MPILNWLGKTEAIHKAGNVPYRILKPNAELSYGNAEAENLLIQGDNLEALKALLPFYAGQVKCIYIDPPYNTKNAFTHYDDNLEHSQWLSLMYPRLELLREFLLPEGSIWISIDDDEGHYLKVICDEVFGRNNFVANVIWQKRTSPDFRATIGAGHDYILVYSKSLENFKQILKPLPKTDTQKASYKNTDNDPRGPWASSDFTAQGWRPNQMYEIITPSGRVLPPPTGRCWKNIESAFLKLVKDDRIWFGKDGNGVPRRKTFLSESVGQTAWTWWPNEEVGHNQEAKKENNSLFGADNSFDTPKPERLIQRMFTLASNSGDLVMDSFLGSGTTAAVAHKMGRRWIGIEMGDHTVTHCVPRLKQVIDGEQGGISQTENWTGGGGYRFYTLGEEIFTPEGKVNPSVKFPTLASHIWYLETGTPLTIEADTPLLGVKAETAYYLLYNGILGDKTVNGGNVLTLKLLSKLCPHEGRRVIYGEASRISKERLAMLNITFKQIPYDIRVG